MFDVCRKPLIAQACSTLVQTLLQPKGKELTIWIEARTRWKIRAGRLSWPSATEGHYKSLFISSVHQRLRCWRKRPAWQKHGSSAEK